MSHVAGVVPQREVPGDADGGGFIRGGCGRQGGLIVCAGHSAGAAAALGGDGTRGTPIWGKTLVKGIVSDLHFCQKSPQNIFFC